MSEIRAGFGMGVLALMLMACTNPPPSDVEASLKNLSATVIPGAEPTAIEISNQKQTLAKWAWKAKFQGKSYACDADEMMRLPACQAEG